MTRTLTVDGKEVKLRASAAIPRLYRIKFRRDILQDMTTIQQALKKSSEGVSTIPLEALELFENVSYLMAKHADPTVPDSVDEWLDGFDTFSIYSVFPVIEEMWTENITQLSVPAKK